MRRHRILMLACICLLTTCTPAAAQNPRATTALSYIERGDEWFARALELNPGFASAYFNRAQVWREGGDRARALVTVEGDVDGITQTERGPYARIAILRPHDGRTVDFEAGYIRHLDWHRRAKDTWVWYGWNIWAGERQGWFVYATFGHSAASLDNPVAPAEDALDNILNVTPHAQFVGNALYEYLPGLSRGTGVPAPAARLEFTTVDLRPGAEKAFEAALSADQSKLQDETLWYRMVAGGTVPRYVRLRPRPSLSAILDGRSELALPDKDSDLIAKMTVEILNLRPTMSYGLSSAHK